MTQSRATYIALLLVAGISFMGIGGYAYSRMKVFLHGPRISVDFPRDGMALTNPATTVAGLAQGVAHITLQGSPIFTDEEGVINEPILLVPGYNLLTLEARDRFGRTTSHEVRVIYETSEDSPPYDLHPPYGITEASATTTATSTTSYEGEEGASQGTTEATEETIN